MRSCYDAYRVTSIDTSIVASCATGIAVPVASITPTRKPSASNALRLIQTGDVGVAGTGAADLHQDLPRPWFWHRHVAQLSGLLPFDEPESLDGLSP